MFTNVYKWFKLFKECRNSIQDEDRSGSTTRVSPYEMVDSVNTPILIDRGAIEDISEKLRISVTIAPKIVHNEGQMSLSFIRTMQGFLLPQWW